MAPRGSIIVTIIYFLCNLTYFYHSRLLGIITKNNLVLPSVMINNFIPKYILAGMSLLVSNPILNYEEEDYYLKEKGKSKFDWTYENDEEPESVQDTLATPLTSEASMNMAPIIVVNSPDDDAEDITITHECTL